MSSLDLRRVCSDFGACMERIGPRVLALRRGGLKNEEKTAHWDIVTKADQLSEEMLVGLVQEFYPDHGVIGEEGTSIPSRSGYVWRFDPIDGTSSFARGSDRFGISAGLEKDGVPIAGVIDYPAIPDTIAAVRGEGLFHFRGTNWYLTPFVPEPEVPPAECLKKALVIADIQAGKDDIFALIRSRVLIAIHLGSMVYDVRELVLGRADAVFHTGATPFDIAAGIVIAREAGCIVSGIRTDALDLDQDHIPVIMARSERLRDELREALGPALAGREA